ncbi:MAG: hypothetical protein ACRCU6_12740, partial [Fusobacteriaceae bacterium]
MSEKKKDEKELNEEQKNPQPKKDEKEGFPFQNELKNKRDEFKEKLKNEMDGKGPEEDRGKFNIK